MLFSYGAYYFAEIEVHYYISIKYVKFIHILFEKYVSVNLFSCICIKYLFLEIFKMFLEFFKSFTYRRYIIVYGLLLGEKTIYWLEVKYISILPFLKFESVRSRIVIS